MAAHMAENSAYRSRCHFIISDSISAPMRISLALLASLVHRYWRTATAERRTSMPVRTMGQNPSTECVPRAREAVRSEPGLYIPPTPHPHLKHQPVSALHL